jgi:Ca2+-binding EF-hand superfamily protein
MALHDHESISHGRFKAASDVLHHVWDLFDGDGSGHVDFSDLAAGLSILCGDGEAEKVAAAFQLFDTDGDGFITQQEMTAYLTSVYRIVFTASPVTAAAMSAAHLTPESLAQETAAAAVSEADSDGDGRLSLPEFSRWYAGNAALMSPSAPPAPTPAHAASTGSQPTSTQQAWPSYEEVRQTLRLHAFTPRETVRIFRDYAVDGHLSLSQFQRASSVLIRLGGGRVTSDTEGFVAGLFQAFDRDGNGVVDLRELGAGLSVFCVGEADEKLRVAWHLFDEDGDGFVSFEELQRYLSAVFRVALEAPEPSGDRLAPRLRSSGISPDELATVTARLAFETCDLNRDGVLSFEEWAKWYEGNA